jgi:hypothetical protein
LVVSKKVTRCKYRGWTQESPLEARAGLWSL